jgi:hypothetical protein
MTRGHWAAALTGTVIGEHTLQVQFFFTIIFTATPRFLFCGDGKPKEPSASRTRSTGKRDVAHYWPGSSAGTAPTPSKRDHRLPLVACSKQQRQRLAYRGLYPHALLPRRGPRASRGIYTPTHRPRLSAWARTHNFRAHLSPPGPARHGTSCCCLLQLNGCG